MTHLLETAFRKLSSLPEAEQDRYATQIIDELKADAIWEEKFAHTTDEQWAKIEAQFRQDRESGGAVPLSDFLKAHDVKPQ